MRCLFGFMRCLFGFMRCAFGVSWSMAWT